MNEVWPERWDALDTPVQPYVMAAKVFRVKDHSSKVLDLACGYEAGTNYLASVGFQVIGVDKDPDAIAICKNRWGSQRLLSFIASDYKDLNFDPSYFDLVVSFHTMEHIADDYHFLKSCHRWLKTGGG